MTNHLHKYTFRACPNVDYEFSFSGECAYRKYDAKLSLSGVMTHDYREGILSIKVSGESTIDLVLKVRLTTDNTLIFCTVPDSVLDRQFKQHTEIESWFVTFYYLLMAAFSSNYGIEEFKWTNPVASVFSHVKLPRNQIETSDAEQDEKSTIITATLTPPCLSLSVIPYNDVPTVYHEAVRTPDTVEEFKISFTNYDRVDFKTRRYIWTVQVRKVTRDQISRLSSSVKTGISKNGNSSCSPLAIMVTEEVIVLNDGVMSSTDISVGSEPVSERKDPVLFLISDTRKPSYFFKEFWECCSDIGVCNNSVNHTFAYMLAEQLGIWSHKKDN